MTIPAKDERTAIRRALDEEIAAEPRLPPPKLPVEAPSDSTPQVELDGLDETLEAKISRYGTPEFKAAMIRHFHEAKRLAIGSHRRLAETVESP
ncbi:MAG: hypothetical protein WD872_11585 [Pirellulaceae bacterium]